MNCAKIGFIVFAIIIGMAMTGWGISLMPIPGMWPKGIFAMIIGLCLMWFGWEMNKYNASK